MGKYNDPEYWKNLANRKKKRDATSIDAVSRMATAKGDLIMSKERKNLIFKLRMSESDMNKLNELSCWFGWSKAKTIREIVGFVLANHNEFYKYLVRREGVIDILASTPESYPVTPAEIVAAGVTNDPACDGCEYRDLDGTNICRNEKFLCPVRW